MNQRAVVYSAVLSGIIAAIALTVIFAGASAPIAVPVYASVAAVVWGLLQSADAAKEVQEVKETVKATAADTRMQTDAIVKVTEHTQQTVQAVHTLVNSASGLQLKSNAVLARRLYNFTKEPDDLAVAMESERLYDEHQAKQALVDANPPPAAVSPGQSQVMAPVAVQEISEEAAKAIADAVTAPKMPKDDRII